MALRRIGLSHLNRLGPTIVLLLILWLGFGLRLWRLGEQNIWWDEGHAIWAARQSLSQTTEITAHDVHPPLYLWLLHGWLRVAGDSEFSVRYLSTIAGLLTVALTFVFSRRLLGRRAALLGTLLIAAGRFHIWWSQEARMYVWAAFLALLSTYFMIRLRQGRGLTWTMYVLSATAALYTLYLSVLALLLQNLFIVLTVWRKPGRTRFLFRWGLTQVGILVLYAPWLQIALVRTRTDVARTAFPFQLVWQLYGTVLATGISTHLDRYAPLIGAFGLLTLGGLALLFLNRRQPQRFGLAGREVGLLFLLPLLLPPVATYLLSLPRGLFYSPKPEARYLLLFSPFFYALLAGTIAHLWQLGPWGRGSAIASTALVIGTFVAVLPGHYAGRYLRDEFQTAMQAIAAYAQPDDAILLVSGDRYPVFLYYYHRQFPAHMGPRVYLLPQNSQRFTAGNVATELMPLADHHPRLWLASLERGLQDPENLVQGWLDTHRTAVLHVPQGHNYLTLYAKENVVPAPDPAAVEPQHVLDDPSPLGDGTSLRGYDLATGEYRPGDTLRLALYLEPGSTGEVDIVADWVAQDVGIVAHQHYSVAAAPDSSGVLRPIVALPIYEYTPPGRYEVRIHTEGDEGPSLTLPTGRVTHSRRLRQPRITHSQPISIGGGRIEFLGHTLRQGRVHPGESLTLDLYWQAQDWIDRDYTVFVHLIGPYNPATGGPVWAQDDDYPLNGGHPTSRWVPGQMVPDRHVLTVPPGTPLGSYQIEVGLYDTSTGQRLDVADSPENRILLDSVQIIAD